MYMIKFYDDCTTTNGPTFTTLYDANTEASKRNKYLVDQKLKTFGVWVASVD